MNIKKTVKTFVLDTNVPLYDPFCLDNFEENNVVIPIVVFQEMDRFKKGNESKNFSAREFSRIVSDLSEHKIFNGGVSLGEGRGTLRISLGVDYPEIMQKSFLEKTADNLIIATALKLKEEGENVVLISKDTNVVLKARSLKIIAEDYKNNEIKDTKKIYDAIGKLKMTKKEIAQYWETSKLTGIIKAEKLEQFSLNQFITINDGELLARNTSSGLEIVRNFGEISGIRSRNDEQTFALNILMDSEIQLVALSGFAGTGKTLLALAAALDQTGGESPISVARPIVGLSGKDLGYLPGNADDKISPYMEPIFDNLEVIRDSGLILKNERVAHKTQKEKKGNADKTTLVEARQMPIGEWALDKNIKVLALTFIRGRTVRARFFIVDEAQNLTPHEATTICTRAGEGTKIVFCGDTTQVDDPYMNELSNGFSFLIDKWKGQPEFGHVHLEKGERSPLSEKAAKIMK